MEETWYDKEEDILNIELVKKEQGYWNRNSFSKQGFFWVLSKRWL